MLLSLIDFNPVCKGFLLIFVTVLQQAHEQVPAHLPRNPPHLRCYLDGYQVLVLFSGRQLGKKRLVHPAVRGERLGNKLC